MRPPSNPTGRIVGRSEIGLPTKVWVPPTPVGQVRSGAATGQQGRDDGVLGPRKPNAAQVITAIRVLVDSTDPSRPRW